MEEHPHNCSNRWSLPPSHSPSSWQDGQFENKGEILLGKKMLFCPFRIACSGTFNKQAVKLLVKPFRVIYWRLCSLRGTIYTSQARCDGFYNIMLRDTNQFCQYSVFSVRVNTAEYLFISFTSVFTQDIRFLKTFVGFLYSLSQWETIWLLNYEANQNYLYII